LSISNNCNHTLIQESQICASCNTYINIDVLDGYKKSPPKTFSYQNFISASFKLDQSEKNINQSVTAPPSLIHKKNHSRTPTLTAQEIQVFQNLKLEKFPKAKNSDVFIEIPIENHPNTNPSSNKYPLSDSRTLIIIATILTVLFIKKIHDQITASEYYNTEQQS
jgi:hypothetical protein